MVDIEFHVQQYGVTKSKDPLKDGKQIGLNTRLIIHNKSGSSTVMNFDFQFEAEKYLYDTYGSQKDGAYRIMSNFKRYGKRGYRW